VQDGQCVDHQKTFLLDRANFGAVSFLYISRFVDHRTTRFLYPIVSGMDELLTQKSIRFADMIELPSSGDWLDWVLNNIWMWDVS
jgi:hypothetical protein